MYKQLKPSAILSPVPVVMVSCAGEYEGRQIDNIITVAWAGTICSEPPMVSISVRKSRLSHELISKSGEFVINFVSEEMARTADWCGVKSGREVSKFTEKGLSPIPVPEMKKAKAIANCPVYLGCVVKQIIELGSHDMFIAEVVSAGADEELFDEQGKLRLDLAELVAYCHGDYVTLGRLLGFYGYSVAAPKVYKERMAKLKAASKARPEPIKKAAPKPEKQTDFKVIGKKGDGSRLSGGKNRKFAAKGGKQGGKQGKKPF